MDLTNTTHYRRIQLKSKYSFLNYTRVNKMKIGKGDILSYA